MQENIGRGVKVYFYDNPEHVTCKSGVLKGIDNSFISVDTGFSTELIAIRKIIRVEVSGEKS